MRNLNYLKMVMENRGLVYGKDPVKLDIGAGGYSTDKTFLSVDLFTKADINAPMAELPLPRNSVDVIHASQCLEHIGKFDVVPTLKEWRRVLKPGGIAQIFVPDLEWVCWWWLTHQTVSWDLDVLFGNQKHEGEYHKTGFTPKILKDYVDAAGGFTVTRIEYVGGNLRDIEYGDNNLIHGVVDARSIGMEVKKNAAT